MAKTTAITVSRPSRVEALKDKITVLEARITRLEALSKHGYYQPGRLYPPKFYGKIRPVSAW